MDEIHITVLGDGSAVTVPDNVRALTVGPAPGRVPLPAHAAPRPRPDVIRVRVSDRPPRSLEPAGDVLAQLLEANGYPHRPTGRN